MKKRLVLILFSILLLVGCNNKVEEEKNEYLDTKSILETNTEFALKEDLPCDITVSLDRTDEENVNYNIIFNKPKLDMDNLKILVIHNQYTEDVFPYIGLLDNKSESLLMNDKDNDIIINGIINTTNDIDSLDLEFRIWMEYTDSNNKKNTVFYKTTI